MLLRFIMNNRMELVLFIPIHPIFRCFLLCNISAVPLFG